MNIELISVIVQVLTVIIAAGAILYSMRGLQQQLRLSTFLEFTRRYSEIRDPLPFEARDPAGSYELDKLPGTEREDVLRIVRKYANLCSEELHQHEKKRIDTDPWEIWKTGMVAQARIWFQNRLHGVANELPRTKPSAGNGAVLGKAGIGPA